ncbi:MAG TPA: hypothetical protein VF669_08360 [Tepidisphaeraceae bacterium]|jgi:hypothetical protein
MRSLILWFTLVTLSLAGCAKYEYNIVSPDQLRAHIPSKTDQVTRVDPLEYRFRSYENRLVIRIFNTVDDPITLVGERSTVVSPDGQSHPLRPQTIAPGSFIKLIFPPLRPQIRPSGPVFGIGIGARVDAATELQESQPKYLYNEFPDEILYWDWNGPTDVTATLVYQRGENHFQHRFTFHRQKM